MKKWLFEDDEEEIYLMWKKLFPYAIISFIICFLAIIL